MEIGVNDLRFELSATSKQNIRQSSWRTLSQTFSVQQGRYALQYRIEDGIERHLCQRYGSSLLELIRYTNCLASYPSGYFKAPVENDYLGKSYVFVDQVKFRLN